ncbi:MAG: hypothetical protein RL570_568 [Actinomycetota bacterium]
MTEFILKEQTQLCRPLTNLATNQIVPAALSDPFWGVVLAGISRVFMSNDLHSLLMVSPLDSTDGPIAHYLEGGEVDGAIFLQVHNSDNLGGALTATRHLFSRGCKQVATLTGDVEASAGIDRLKGYRAAHLEAGREINEDLIANCDWTFESAKTMTLRLLARNPEVDGIFAANDIMALGAIAAIQERGRLVPDDIAVVGFDDNIVAQTHRPGLTTIRQDIVGLGAAAAETMISVLQNREPNIQMLPTEIIIRESA